MFLMKNVMKSMYKQSFYLLVILLLAGFSACSKVKPLVGTYEGVTTNSGTYKLVIPEYDEISEAIPPENKSVIFEITKGNKKNQIILKQIAGNDKEQFQTTGIVNKKEVVFDSFDIGLGYENIQVSVKVYNMKGTFDDGLFTYDYTYKYAQSLFGYSVSINMKANGEAQKK